MAGLTIIKINDFGNKATVGDIQREAHDKKLCTRGPVSLCRGKGAFGFYSRFYPKTFFYF